MSSIEGVKDEVRVDGETKIGGFRFQKYLQEKVVHIHNPEDEKVEYPIKEFLKHTDKFMNKLENLEEGELIKLLNLKVTGIKDWKSGMTIELDLNGCKDTVDKKLFINKMNEFIKLLEKN